MKKVYALIVIALVSTLGFSQHETTSRSLFFMSLKTVENAPFNRKNQALTTFAFDGIKNGVLQPYDINYEQSVEKQHCIAKVPQPKALNSHDWLKKIVINNRDSYYNEEYEEDDYSYSEKEYLLPESLSLISLDVTTTFLKSDSIKRVNYINFYLDPSDPFNSMGIEEYKFSLKWTDFVAYLKNNHPNCLYYTQGATLSCKEDMILIQEGGDVSALFSDLMKQSIDNSKLKIYDFETNKKIDATSVAFENTHPDFFMLEKKGKLNQIGFHTSTSEDNFYVTDWKKYRGSFPEEEIKFQLLTTAMSNLLFDFQSSRLISEKGYFLHKPSNYKDDHQYNNETLADSLCFAIQGATQAEDNIGGIAITKFEKIENSFYQNFEFFQQDKSLIYFIHEKILSGELNIYTDNTLQQYMVFEEYKNRITLSAEISNAELNNWYDMKDLASFYLTSTSTFDNNGFVKMRKLNSIGICIGAQNSDNMNGIEIAVATVSWKEVNQLLIEAEKKGDIDSEIREALHQKTYISYLRQTSIPILSE